MGGQRDERKTEGGRSEGALERRREGRGRGSSRLFWSAILLKREAKNGRPEKRRKMEKKEEEED